MNQFKGKAMENNADVLEQLASSLANGTINIVDLTHPLGPQTPMIKVPEGHGKQPPAVQLEPIADYRDKSGYARWSTLIVAEHAGTHFDAPGHWFTGEKFKDGTTDTINAKRFANARHEKKQRDTWIAYDVAQRINPVVAASVRNYDGLLVDHADETRRITARRAVETFIRDAR